MVTVSEIRQIRSCACIILDTDERFWLSVNDLKNAGITEGMSYERVSLLKQICKLQYPHALNVAVSMLSRRPCSKGEISSRLQHRCFTDEVNRLVIQKLDKEKLVDDVLFCDQWIRFRADRGYGPSVIRHELIMKGVPENTINAAMKKANAEERLGNAVKQAEKAWTRIMPDMDIRIARQKVINSLVRRGYSWEDARQASDLARKEVK